MNTSISRPMARASALMSATIFVVASTPWRDVEVAVKKASQLRSAKAWPEPDEPAFMISGRVPP